MDDLLTKATDLHHLSIRSKIPHDKYGQMNNLKIMRIHFSYNQKLEEEKNLNDEIAKIENV